MNSLSSRIIKTTAVSLVKQASPAQDYAFSGISLDNTFEFVGVADGHGKSINAVYPTMIFKKTNKLCPSNRKKFRKFCLKDYVEKRKISSAQK